MTILIDGGASHKFIDTKTVHRMRLEIEQFDGFDVAVAGSILTCTIRVNLMELTLGGIKIQDDFYVVDIGDIEVVIGVQWLQTLEEYRINHHTMELEFEWDGKEVVLKGLSQNGPMMVFVKRMERFFYR